jgi:hypothetical protein
LVLLRREGYVWFQLIVEEGTRIAVQRRCALLRLRRHGSRSAASCLFKHAVREARSKLSEIGGQVLRRLHFAGRPERCENASYGLHGLLVCPWVLEPRTDPSRVRVAVKPANRPVSFMAAALIFISPKTSRLPKTSSIRRSRSIDS